MGKFCILYYTVRLMCACLSFAGMLYELEGVVSRGFCKYVFNAYLCYLRCMSVADVAFDLMNVDVFKF